MIEPPRSPESSDALEWRNVPLSEIATTDRQAVKPEELLGTELYVGLKNITIGGQFENVTTAREADLKSTKFVFTKDHVLYGKLRPYLSKIAAPTFEGICSTDILPIRPGPHLNRRYLLHFLRTPRMVDHAASRAVGINLPRLNPKVLETFKVPLPPLNEQRRIASVLDAAEVLRAKRRQALAQLDSLTQAIFVDMFGSNRGDTWETLPVADLAASTKGAIRTGPFGSQLLHEEFMDDGPVAVLGIDNAVDNHFSWRRRRFISAEKYEDLKRYTVRPGDVIITIMGTCGRVAIVPDDIPLAINTKHLCCITLDQDRCLPEFLWACLRFHPGVLRQLGATRGAVMPGLNMGVIKRAEIPVPPIEAQERFARWKTHVEQQVVNSTTHLSCLDDLFASLQQRAFRGEL